jgi:rhodanese-related sulfurtransferase
MKRIAFIAVIGALFLASACGGTAASTPVSTISSTAMPGTPVAVQGGGIYWEITPAQLAGFKTKDFFLADTDAAYVGEISSTDLFIKPADIQANLDKFPSDKNAKIVLYCTMGVQSQAAAITLVQDGYTRIMELKGGITEWKNEGYPTLMLTRTMI